MSRELELEGMQPRKCRGCGGRIEVTREVWRGKERWMLHHGIPECEWFKTVRAAKAAVALGESISSKGRK